MKLIEWKLRVSALWLMQPVNYVAFILISLFEAQPFGEAIEPGGELIIAIFFFIPCLMVWLSLVSWKASRWPNIVLGAAFVLLKLTAVSGLVTQLSLANLLNELWGALAAALVVMYAWRQPGLIEPGR